MKKIFTIIVPFMVFLFVPFIVDATETKLFASDAAVADYFGLSVAMGNGVALVGTPGRDGSPGNAYLYWLDTVTGNWVEQKLTASDTDRYDLFGSSVAIDGSIAIIGAENAVGDLQGKGAAYVFVTDPVTGNSIEQTILTASDGALFDYFGHSVSISGDTAIIGAFKDDDKGSDSGSAYIFVRDPVTDTWAQQQKLLASDGASGHNFGRSVAISGNTVVVGASGNSSAYIFEQNPVTGNWGELKLPATDVTSVAISGDTVVVGRGATTIGGSTTYLFERDPVTGNWTQLPNLKASDGATQDNFGSSVAISSDTLIVGARSAGTAGAAYVFVIDAATGNWVEHQKIVSTAAITKFANFGMSVAINGNTAIVGAIYDSFNNLPQTGSAYIYTPVGGAVTEPDITVTDSAAPIDDLTLVFGDVTEFSFSEETITVTNDGDADLIIGTIPSALLPDLYNGVDQYTVEVDNCSGQPLAPASSCTLTVRFSPQSTGYKVTRLTIPSNDPFENPVDVTLNGTGLGAAVADITVTDSIAPVDDLQIAFGNVSQGTFSEEMVTIANDGNADLLIGNIATQNILVAPFSILNNTCSSTTVVPAANCTFTVRFEPTSAINSNDSFDIPSDDTDEATVTITLSGTGTVIQVPDINVTDSVLPADDLQLAFGDVLQGTAADETFTVSNTGTAALTIGNIANANMLAAPFSLFNDSCSGQTVAVAASCSLTVRFAPTAATISNDSFDIPSDDPDENPVTLNLSGTGISTVILAPEISLNDQLSFGYVATAASSDKTITISNDGTADLSIGNIAQANALDAPFSILNDNCSAQIVAAAASCTLTLRYEPVSAGSFNDSFDVPSNDADEASITINVSGTSGEANVEDAGDSNNDLFGLALNPQLLFGLFIMLFISHGYRRL